MLILPVIWSFQVFEFIFIVTRGGPAYGSEVLSTVVRTEYSIHADMKGEIR
jgi:ABC-type sugar transport system permease subunit